MRTSSALLLVAVVVVTVAAPASAIIKGEWEPVEDVDDPHIQGLGRWAVAQTSVLSFDKVVAAMQPPADGPGMNYELTISASNRVVADGRYRAVVYEQDWSDTIQLVSFDGARPGPLPRPID